jgi:hypothetical protein
LEEEWRRLPVTYAYRERQWVDRAIAVPTGSIEFAAAEGMVAYATKQGDMYRELAERAEITRTEVSLRRGMKRTVYQRSWDPVMPIDGGGDAESDDDNADEEDDEWGDIESDEELLMGGEVDDD